MIVAKGDNSKGDVMWYDVMIVAIALRQQREQL